MTIVLFFLFSPPISTTQGKLKMFKPAAPFYTTEVGLKVQQRITDIVIFEYQLRIREWLICQHRNK